MKFSQKPEVKRYLNGTQGNPEQSHPQSSDNHQIQNRRGGADLFISGYPKQLL